MEIEYDYEGLRLRLSALCAIRKADMLSALSHGDIHKYNLVRAEVSDDIFQLIETVLFEHFSEADQQLIASGINDFIVDKYDLELKQVKGET